MPHVREVWWHMNLNIMEMSDNVKRMDISEFRECGYLQEVNRRFFHPLGLALEVIIEDGEEKLGGIWDCRNDDEGIFYDIKNSDEIRKERFSDNKSFIDGEFIKRLNAREASIGFGIEPIEEDE